MSKQFHRLGNFVEDDVIRFARDFNIASVKSVQSQRAK